jgi:tight adherence protein C
MTPVFHSRELGWVFAGFAAFTVATLVYVMACTPTVEGRYLGVRGFRRTRALDAQPWSALEPFVRWMGARLRPLLPDSLCKSLDKQLAAAGQLLGLVPEEFVAITILSLWTGGVAGFLLVALKGLPPLTPIVLSAIGAVLPFMFLSQRGQQRLRRIQSGLPYAIDVVALGLSAGLDFPACLRQVVDKASDPDDALIDEVSHVLRELQLGKTRGEALTAFADRAPVESAQEFVGAVLQAEEQGNPLAEILTIQATSSRMRRTTVAEDHAAKAGVKIIIPCLLVFITVMILVIGPLVLTAGSLIAGGVAQ